MTSYTGLGLMSGTSLDGLDICCVEFTGDMNCDIWSYRIRSAYTVPYDDTWRERLAGAKTLSGLELIRLHYDYAHFTGQAIQVRLERLCSLQGARHTGEIGEVCGYAHFSGQATQVRLERCVAMPTSRGKLYR